MHPAATQRSSGRLERQIHLVFVVAATAIICMSLLLYNAMARSQEASRRLEQISSTLNILHKLRLDYIQVEASLQDYDITGNPASLDANAAALRRIDTGIAGLGVLLAHQPEQRQRAQQMAALFAQYRNALDAARAPPLAGESRTLPSLQRQRFFDLASDISSVTLSEFNDLGERAQHRLRATLLMLIGVMVAGLLVVVPAYLGLMAQIRARRNAERQQKESNDILRLTVDSADGMIAYVDRDQRLKFHNLAYARLFGRGKAPLVDTTLPQALGEEVYDTLRQDIARVLEGQPVRREVRLNTNGHAMDMRISLVPRLDENGRIQGFFGQMADITEFKHKEALLLEKTTFQKAILDSARISIITTDREGIIRSFNVGAERMLGYRAEELIGQDTPARYHDELECRKRAQELSAELGEPVKPGIEVFIARARRGHIEEQEWNYVRKDGSRLPVFLSITALRTDQGEIIGYLGIAFDITRQKETEAQLMQARAEAEAASRAKSAFLATMSHEIRTPMNGVLGMAEVLARSRLSSHQAEMVQTIRESAGVLLNLIDDILDFSKIEAGHFALDRTAVCIRDLAEGICTSLQPVAARKGVGLDVFISPEIPERVIADDMRLRQVLYNLVGNAIKFSSGQPDKHGRVWLRAEVEQVQPLKIAFRIIDNGIGIAAEIVDKLFLAFTQAVSSSTRRFGGTGLGLAICKRLVEMAHGEIKVDSTPGIGSTFTVALPFEPAAEQPPPPFPNLGGIHCIVVESPHLVAGNLRAYLVPQGAEVRIAPNLDVAATMAAATPPPVVVVQDASNRPAAERALRKILGEAPAVRHLLLTRGSRRQARIEETNVVSLDADALPRRNLLHGVAIAAGRVAPAMLHDQAGGIAAAEASTPGASSLILVAEDDLISQKVILRQLDLLGYAAEVADNGIEALRLWRSGRHALLLTDLHMPQLDGYGLAMTIRAEEPAGQHLPILALSANALRGETGRALAAGMDAYLTKPVQLDTLQQALEKWLAFAVRPAATSAAALHGASHGILRTGRDVIDIRVLKALVGDDEEAVQELLDEYLQSVRQQAEEVRHAAGDGDISMAGNIVHKLKSSSRSVGAMSLADACADLEHAARTGDKAALMRGMPKFETAAAAVKNALAGLRAERNDKLAETGHENPPG